jgi:hypothetical protein
VVIVYTKKIKVVWLENIFIYLCYFLKIFTPQKVDFEQKNGHDIYRGLNFIKKEKVNE